MVCIATVAVAHNLGVNLRAALLCALQRLDDKHSRTLTHYKAVAVKVEEDEIAESTDAEGETAESTVEQTEE